MDHKKSFECCSTLAATAADRNVVWSLQLVQTLLLSYQLYPVGVLDGEATSADS